MIRLRDIPGVGTLEWALEQRGGASHSPLHGFDEREDLNERAHDFAAYLFGISDDEIDLDDSHFPVLRMFRDEQDEYWRSHGWDVTDGEGGLLRVMEYFTRPLVCVVEKLDEDAVFEGGEADLEAWTASLEEAAKHFKPSR